MMKAPVVTLLLIAALMTLAAALPADDSGGDAAGSTVCKAATTRQPRWMSGYWAGDGLGGRCEEIWVPGPGASMAGVFRLIRDNKVMYYQILSFDRHDEDYSLRFRHFNPDLTGWEEKDSALVFPFVKSQPGQLVCGGIDYRTITSDTMEVLVSFLQENGETYEFKIRYGRVPTGLISRPAGGTENTSLNDHSWLVGNWTGDGLGGSCQEIWSRAEGGSMMGLFKLVKGDRAAFYELMTIVEEEGSPTMKLKHFAPDLRGWEEKDEVITFPGKGGDAGTLSFDGLEYRQRSQDLLQISVDMAGRDGQVESETLELRRTSL